MKEKNTGKIDFDVAHTLLCNALVEMIFESTSCLLDVLQFKALSAGLGVS